MIETVIFLVKLCAIYSKRTRIPFLRRALPLCLCLLLCHMIDYRFTVHFYVDMTCSGISVFFLHSLTVSHRSDERTELWSLVTNTIDVCIIVQPFNYVRTFDCSHTVCSWEHGQDMCCTFFVFFFYFPIVADIQ